MMTRKQVAAAAAQLASLMYEICKAAEQDRSIDELICECYPFSKSLDEVANSVSRWSEAMGRPVIA